MREALVPLTTDHVFSCENLDLACPACYDEWCEGRTDDIPIMEMESVPILDDFTGEQVDVGHYFQCGNCMQVVSARFVLWDLGRHIPASHYAWN